MNNYVTLVEGESRTALNSLWAILKYKRFEPDKILLISSDGETTVDELVKDFKKLLKNYEIDCSVESKSIEEIHKAGEIVSDFVMTGSEKVALDISAASKYMTTKVIIDSRPDLFDHVFYLDVEGIDLKERPFPTIEKSKVELKDLKLDGER
ncbi:MAG: hypothetical protein ACOC8Y_01575 [Candidatus Natronoplasma sp.]